MGGRDEAEGRRKTTGTKRKAKGGAGPAWWAWRWETCVVCRERFNTRVPFNQWGRRWKGKLRHVCPKCAEKGL